MSPEREKQMNRMVRSLSKCLKQLRSLAGHSSELDALVFDLPLQRTKTKLVRSFFVWGIGSYIDEVSKTEGCKIWEPEDKNLFTEKLPFIAEMILCLQYADNQIFDKKKGVTTDIKTRNNILSHNLLERALFEYIRKNLSDATLVEEFTKTTLNLADVGQYIEGTYNSFEYYDGIMPRHKKGENKLPSFSEIRPFLDLIDFEVFVKDFKSVFPQPYKNFVHLYMLRIALTSSALFVQFSDLVMKLKRYNGEHKKNVLLYAFMLGVVFQLVNDINDFVPSAYEKRTLAKNASDCFSDIKNKNITLPILIHLLNNDAYQQLDLTKLNNFVKIKPPFLESTIDIAQFRILNLLEKGFNISPEEEKDLLLEISPVLLQYSMPIAQKWAEESTAFLDTENIPGQLLTELLEIAYDNQYYRYIQSMYSKSIEKMVS